jgi:hypothetical protein
LAAFKLFAWIDSEVRRKDAQITAKYEAARDPALSEARQGFSMHGIQSGNRLGAALLEKDVSSSSSGMHTGFYCDQQETSVPPKERVRDFLSETPAFGGPNRLSDWMYKRGYRKAPETPREFAVVKS